MSFEQNTSLTPNTMNEIMTKIMDRIIHDNSSIESVEHNDGLRFDDRGIPPQSTTTDDLMTYLNIESQIKDAEENNIILDDCYEIIQMGQMKTWAIFLLYISDTNKYYKGYMISGDPKPYINYWESFSRDSPPYQFDEYN